MRAGAVPRWAWHAGGWGLLLAMLLLAFAVGQFPVRPTMLLQALAQQPHRPLGRDRLIALAYGPDHTATDRSIDVQVMRLRKLIEADPAQPRHIRTVWGVGYVFVPDGAAPGGGGKP
mgnify:CR=1 FL=1